MIVPHCCDRQIVVVGPDELGRYAVECARCHRLLVVSDGPREEVFADL